MKKNQLIKLLQEMQGNPEVFVWNGAVNDVMPLSAISEDKLHKNTKSFYRLLVDGDKSMKTASDEWKDKKALALSKNSNWELESGYEDESMTRTKRILVIEPKTTGRKSLGRGGNISY
jgi:hypothetical protein